MTDRLPLLFYCERLDCRLSLRACAERHVQAEAAGSGWRAPPHMASMVQSCRGCPTGKDTSEYLKVKAPRMPPPVALSEAPRLPQKAPKSPLPAREVPKSPKSSRKPSTARWVCERCGTTYRPASNRQKRCRACSRARRYRKLRRSTFYVCKGCNCAYVPKPSTRLDYRDYCSACRGDRERQRKNRWARKADQKFCGRCNEELHDHRASYCTSCRKIVRRAKVRIHAKNYRARLRKLRTVTEG